VKFLRPSLNHGIRAYFIEKRERRIAEEFNRLKELSENRLKDEIDR
jgi:hypothetical protein